ncbi:MAG: hypothetical protein FJW21_14075 [Acidimicrobiia bacterium]|nr:hypothetical protein [Acidimicrobiia bacterium]
MRRVSPAVTWYLAALGAALVVGPVGPVYWDTFGYVAQSLTGHIGGLGVGRPVFAIASQAVASIWQLVGGSVWDLEVVLRVVWLLVAACAAPLTRRLALEAGLTDRAAHLAAAFVAASPAFAHSSATVLTDGASTTFVLLTWIVAMRAVREDAVRTAALAGVWLGIALGLREASMFSAATVACLGLAASPRPRLRLLLAFGTVTAAVVIVPMAWVYLTQPGYVETIQGWLRGLEHDEALKAWDVREAGLIASWLLLFGPLPLVLAFAAFRRWRAAGPWRWGLVAPAWFQWGVMMTYVGITYSPRYLMTSFPAAVAIPAAWWLDRCLATPVSTRMRQALVLALCLPLLGARLIVRPYEAKLLAISSSLAADLSVVPADAVIVTGHACPVVPMIRELVKVEPRLGMHAPAWTAICPGWGWPVDIVATLDGHLAAGRTVVLDMRDDAWQGREQLRSRDDLREYAREGSTQHVGMVILWE